MAVVQRPAIRRWLAAADFKVTTQRLDLVSYWTGRWRALDLRTNPYPEGRVSKQVTILGSLLSCCSYTELETWHRLYDRSPRWQVKSINSSQAISWPLAEARSMQI